MQLLVRLIEVGMGVFFTLVGARKVVQSLLDVLHVHWGQLNVSHFLGNQEVVIVLMGLPYL